MPRLTYLTSARRDLAKIAGDIEDASQSRFFRYTGGESSREIIEIIHVVHGARDLKAFFGRTYGAAN